MKVAGCTLDASAKIYAGRVDSIYNDAFKVLGGFGRSDNQGTFVHVHTYMQEFKCVRITGHTCTCNL